MRLTILIFSLFFLVVAFAIGITAAQAQTPLGIGTAEPSFSSSFAPIQHVLVKVNQYQQEFYHALTAALKSMRDDPIKVLGLIGLSFAYGVFHAAGPGHGKAVISSYMIANETELKRGIFISLLSSLAQAVTAILLVGTAYLFLRGTSISVRDATLFMERASFLLVAGFGAWMLISKIRAIISRSTSHTHRHDDPTTEKSHHHEHTHHEKHHSHDPDCGCGHTHMPEPKALGGKNFNWRGASSAILAIGMRPCSGALIVLTFALLNGLILGGIASVFAMAIGTAITVSILAIIAVSAKGLAIRLSGPGSTRATRIGYSIELTGALLVFLMGLTLFAASMIG